MNKNSWVAGLLNFFFMGLGTLYNGHRKSLGLALTLGAAALAFVEYRLFEADPFVFRVMLAGILMVNSGLAIDASQEARAINAGLPVRKSTCEGGIIVKAGVPV